MDTFTKIIKEATGYDIESASRFDFTPHISLLEFKKNARIPKLNLSPDYFSIITKGTIFLYWSKDQRHNTIINFKRKGEVLRPAIEIGSVKCGELYAKCLTPVTIYSIKRDHLCSCTFQDKKLSDFYFGLLTNDINSTYCQLKMLKEANIEKRYQIFKEEYADIFNTISDRMIANYLGVHYTTLARMKVRLLKNK
ncbi:hypothetical protein QUH73_18595 [Labilibaculum sp. K2S]|uniref:hypothetical protein n=1 Tax=Labilibaculum sp. K2S TaxID=3056386 RepID=UPI0025A49F72|nr:hypothetical protein [Labilibaculum sp. K2S]MDM8161832.1 hypothetical protein [Labilibaculum sp. K2S]